MAKKDNIILQLIPWLIISGLVLYLLIQGSNQLTPLIIQQPMQQQAQVPLNPEKILYSYNLMLTINPESICAGEQATGKLDSTIPFGICSVFMDSGRGYQFYENVNLDSNGDYSETNTMNNAGIFRFKAVCCDQQGNCRISNEDQLVVVLCEPTVQPDGDENGGGQVTPTPTPCTSLYCYDNDNSMVFPNNLLFVGTCTDDCITLTDTCIGSSTLREYYCAPTNSPTHCAYVDYGCAAFFGSGAVCSGGKCSIPAGTVKYGGTSANYVLDYTGKVAGQCPDYWTNSKLSTWTFICTGGTSGEGVYTTSTLKLYAYTGQSCNSYEGTVLQQIDVDITTNKKFYIDDWVKPYEGQHVMLLVESKFASGYVRDDLKLHGVV